MILGVANFIVKNFFNVSVQEKPIYLVVILLFILNITHTILITRITNKGGKKIIQKIKNEIHFQIISDLLLLTVVIHYSGGVENPLVLIYFLHMIVSSSIFPLRTCYFHTIFALLSLALLTLFELTGILPHYHLEGFTNPELYKNTFFIFSVGFVYSLTSFIIVSLSNRIISKSIKSEELYVKTNIELENKDKIQNEYIQRVTHDIKGHLAAISSCLEVVRTKIKGDLNSTQEEFINRAHERTALLTSFVKDLLNLTYKKMQNSIEPEECSIADMIKKVDEIVRILLKEKNLTYSYHIDNQIKTIICDPYSIEELFLNLITNAIKYTPKNGKIGLNIRDRYDYIVCEVSDTGIGIPNEDLLKIFDEFYRASNAPKDSKSGSGLGLSIARQIVENHRGRIWASSELGKWTKIIFTLPKNLHITTHEND